MSDARGQRDRGAVGTGRSCGSVPAADTEDGMERSRT